jgi:MFS family permease
VAAQGDRLVSGPRYRWLLLLSVMVGTMASIMSSTIVNVAVPDMSHFTSRSARSARSGSASGFMVAMTVSMLTTPWLLARYGYRRTYVGTMVLLLAGGVVGGLANSFPLVLAARVAEGLAAGVVQPIPAIIIMRAFEPHEQGRAMRHLRHGRGAGAGHGPSIGGVLVDLFGWRSIFFMVVPFCLASLWLSYRFVPTTAPGGVAASRAARRWTGVACCWPAPARCACSMAWCNCTRRRHRAGRAAAGGSGWRWWFVAWQRR